MVRNTAVALASLALVVTACKSPEQKRAEEVAKQMEAAAKQMEAATQPGQANLGDAMSALGAAMGAANAGRQIETVDFRELRDLLPAALPGMKRTEATGEKNAAMGMQVSTAKGSYQNDDGGSSMNVSISDMGTLSGLMGMATFAWAAAEVDRETGTGYEKTTRIDGHKALEKYDRQTRWGEITVMVADRFVVTVDGNGVDPNGLKAAVGQVNLGKLNGMKDQGVK